MNDQYALARTSQTEARRIRAAYLYGILSNSVDSTWNSIFKGKILFLISILFSSILLQLRSVLEFSFFHNIQAFFVAQTKKSDI